MKIILFRLAHALYTIAIFVLSSLPGVSFSDSSVIDDLLHFLAHSVEFGIFAFLLLMSKYFRGFKINALFSLIVSVIYAFSDEVHQYFVPGRFADPIDFLADSFGILLVVLVYYASRINRSKSE